MAAQFAVRLALIAFAAVSFRGVIDRALFYETVSLALTAGCFFLGLGLIVGELAKRTSEELARNDFDQMMEIQNDERPAAAPSISPTQQH